MKLHALNADKKLASIISAIGRNPTSWRGWKALHIDIKDSGPLNSAEECLLWVQSVLGSYLKGVEGRAFYCDDLAVHVLSKDVDIRILSEAGQQIADLLKEEDGLTVDVQVFDLTTEGGEYVEEVMSSYSFISSMPLAKDTSLAEDAQHLTRRSMENKGHDGASAQDVRVMLVEDDPVARWMVRSALKSECDLVTAVSAGQAFSKYKEFAPDIVFLDINLPDRNGRVVLEWIVSHDPGACVVMFSGNDDIDNIAETLEEGASGFIAKPFLKEDLLGYIHMHKNVVSSQI